MFKHMYLIIQFTDIKLMPLGSDVTCACCSIGERTLLVLEGTHLVQLRYKVPSFVPLMKIHYCTSR